MFRTEKAGSEKGEQTRAAILESALRLFRERGFDAATMRDIAAEVGMALGAAYYYFPGKEAIVSAYYESVQQEHARRVAEAFAAGRRDFRERLKIVFHTKLDIVQDDRRLLGTIFRYAGEPDHPLSCLGPATAGTRRESIELIERALEGESLPKDLRQLLPLALWALQMGVLVYFIYDRSPHQERTRKLVNNALDLGLRLLSLTKSPLLKPVRGRLLNVLRDADLLPGNEERPAHEEGQGRAQLDALGS